MNAVQKKKVDAVNTKIRNQISKLESWYKRGACTFSEAICSLSGYLTALEESREINTFERMRYIEFFSKCLGI